MNCPACGNTMSRVIPKGKKVELDVCNGGCGGIWFDGHEFKQFDEPHEAAQVLMNIKTDPSVKVDASVKRDCPRCENVPMVKRFFSIKKDVRLDECYTCAGIFLDGGELEHIHSLFESEEEKIAAFVDMVGDVGSKS